MNKIMPKIKNGLLLSMPLISNLKKAFQQKPFELRERVDWYLFLDYTKRIDFAVMYYTVVVNFLILSYCLFSPKGIVTEVKFFILVICILDMIHMTLTAGQGFGVAKIGLAVFITSIVSRLNKGRWLKRNCF